MSAFGELLRRQMEGLCRLENSQVETLEAHWRLLTRWNPTLNLTSVIELQDAVRKHYAESIFLASRLPAGRLRIADVGSGAGFPGIPLAVVRPECAVVLIESHQRKSVFLREATRKLENVRVVARRCEVVEEEFDWVVSRAVRPREVIRYTARRRAAAALIISAGDLRQLNENKEVMSHEFVAFPWNSSSGVALVRVESS